MKGTPTKQHTELATLDRRIRLEV